MSRAVIIIPTYNHIDDCLRPCIESIIKYTNLNKKENGARVVVVANGCVDGTAQYLRHVASIYPWLYYEIIDEQLGYTKAVNIGLKRALQFEGFDRFVLLNNDVKLLEQQKNNWLEILESGFTHDKVGVTGVVMKRDEVVHHIEFLIFFCVMISRIAIETIGMLDEEFSPGFGDDIDFCERCRRGGFEVLRVPIGSIQTIVNNMYTCEFPIYHAGTKTFITEPDYQEVINRNRRLLVKKHGLA